MEQRGSMLFLPQSILHFSSYNGAHKELPAGSNFTWNKGFRFNTSMSSAFACIDPINHPQKFWCFPHKYVLGFLWYPRIYKVSYHPLSQCCYLPKIHWKPFRKEKQGTAIGNSPAWIIHGEKGPFPLKSQEILGKFLEGAAMHTLCSVPQSGAQR